MPTSSIKQIKKRNGEIVDFIPGKILIAISKAFADVKGKADQAVTNDLTDKIVVLVEQEFDGKVPVVEDIQNFVEKVLMEAGYFDVAKSYIIYRYEHEKIREKKKEVVQEKIDKEGLYVVKKHGQKEVFSMEKLKAALAHYIKGYEDVIDINVVADQIRMEVYEDMPTKEVARAITMVLRSFIEHDPAYSFAAARSLLAENYKTVVGTESIDFTQLEGQLNAAFVQNIQKGVQTGKLDPRMLTFDLEGLSRSLVHSRDNDHTYLSAQTIVDRYLLRETHKMPEMETIQTFWMRVAMGMAINETNKNDWAKKFYEEMSTLRYIPSTPTLFHSGTDRPQLSSCYLTTIDDSLDHIFKCVGDNAQLSKWSGGIGNDWTNLRGTGALIKGTGVGSQGVIPFLKIANDTTAAINRSGRRRGATCAYLETWHWDIEDFLELRKNTGDERRRTHDMNTANWIPDLFMKRVKEDGQWSLMSPNEVPELHHLYGQAFERKYEEYEKKGEAGELELYKKIKARDLWKKMLTMLFETGHPWMTWKDPSNVRSPQDHAGVVHSSNLCTEITLNTSGEETAVCNLGSVNMNKFVVNGGLDTDLLAKTVSIAMRMLDNVIDINFYPTKEARQSNMRHRPVGIGLRGFQDALYMLDIPFDSDAAVAFADRSMEVISYHTILTSSQLARERGAYASYRGSKWDRGIFPLDTIELLEQERGMKIPVDRNTTMDWTPVRESVKLYGMRNSNTMAVAPTATTANISGCFPTIEPIYKNIYVKSNQAGDFTIVNPYLVEDLKKHNLWDAEMLGKIKYNDGRIGEITEIPQALKDKYKEVFEIDSKWLVKIVAHRGKWIDQSQSFNVFYAGASGKEINDIYMYAWEMGLKTTYYLRTLAVSQVEKSTVSVEKFGKTHLRGQGSSTSAPLPPKASAPVPVATPVTPAAPAPAPTPAATVTAPKQLNSVGAMVNTATQVQPSNTSDIMPDQMEVPACRIDDPDCESCSG